MEERRLIRAYEDVDLTKPSFSPVSEKNAALLTDLYVGMEAPREGYTRGFMVVAMLGVAGWTMGWRFGVETFKNRYFSDW